MTLVWTVRVRRLWGLCCLWAATVLASPLAHAHAGEDHGEAGSGPAPTQAIAPRAWAQSEDFEVVAVLEDGPAGRRLRITVDQFGSNAPVPGARLELELDGQPLAVQEEQPGVYVAQPTQALAAPAHWPLTISIESGDTSDLLSTRLDVPAAAPNGAAQRRPGALGVGAVVAAVAALALLGWGLRRRRQQRRTL